jgi:homoserine dehydrogenase
MSATDVAKSAAYDVLIELTTLEIFSGQPAIDHIKTAFLRGKHAITANKGPIAWAYRELRDLADKNNCLFFYETTVMDGSPVFNLVEHTLKMCKITEIQGILNSTTNFLLRELENGVAYGDAIKKGQEIGFVEADPSLDVLGWDAAAKVTALMNVHMDAGITPLDIDRTGIEDITPEKIEDAKKRGKVIKLICGGSVEGGIARGFVKPREIDTCDLFASINGASSVVSFTTDLMGTISVVAHDPGIKETAYGVFGDTLRVIENL